MSALKVQLDTHGLMVTHLDGLVPVPGDALKGFGFSPSSKCFLSTLRFLAALMDRARLFECVSMTFKFVVERVPEIFV